MTTRDSRIAESEARAGPTVVSPPTPGSLGHKFVNTLANGVNEAIKLAIVPLSTAFDSGVTSVLTFLEGELERIFGPTLDEIADIHGLPPITKELLGRSRGEEAPIQILAALAFIGGVALQGLFAALQPTLRLAGYEADKRAQSGRIDPGSLGTLLRREKIPLENVQNEFADLGYSTDRRDYMLKLADQLPDIGSILELRRRGHLEPDEADDLLTKLGFLTDDRVQILRLVETLPNAGELAEQLRRGVIDRGTAITGFETLGLSEGNSGRLADSVMTRLDIGSILELRRRGRLEPAKAKTALEELGYTSDLADDVLTLATRTPDLGTVIDLVAKGQLSPSAGRVYLEAAGVPENVIDGSLNVVGQRIDPINMWRAQRRTLTSETDARQEMTDAGWSEGRQDILRAMSRQVLDITTLRDGFHRGAISATKLDEELTALGLDDESIKALKAIFPIMPGPSDLVRFAQREAFDEAAVAQFDLDTEFPAEFGELGKKIGLGEEFTKLFWRAHWDLPSIQQGFEMLHRNAILPEDLKTLFRVADILPFWREPFEKISYSPYTRVDVRRMSSVGVLGPDAVFDAYKDAGYDTERATKLAEWTIMDNAQGERDLTRTDVISAYRLRQILRPEAKEALQALGYVEDHAELFLEREDFGTENRRVNAELDWVKFQYVQREIDNTGLIEELAGLDLSGEEQARIVAEFEVARRRNRRFPTKKELFQFKGANIIDEPRLRVELAKMGYTDEVVGWYVDRAGSTDDTGDTADAEKG